MVDLTILLDILGLLFGVAGIIYIGKKDRRGFLLFIIGSTSHGLLGMMQGLFGIMLTSSVFILFDIYYYYKWGRGDE